MLSDKFVDEAEEYRKDLLDYKSLLKEEDKTEVLKLRNAKKLREVKEDLTDLIEQAQDAKAGRKLVYKVGYGVPRESFNNIVYKMIQHGQYGKLFDKLKNIKDDESKKTLFQTILRQG